MTYENQLEHKTIDDNILSPLEKKLCAVGAGIVAVPTMAFAKEQGECAIRSAQMMVEDFDFLSSYITAYSGSISVIFGGLTLAAIAYATNELIIKPTTNLYNKIKA